MSDDGRSDRSRAAAKAREELGYRSRLERRTAKRVVRRREVATKMWRAVVPAALLIAVIVVLLITFGGRGDGDVAQGTATTVAAEPRRSGSLLVIDQDGAVAEVLVIQPTEGGGVVMAVPGITLLKTSTGFTTIAELQGSGAGASLPAALAEAFGVMVTPAATVEWTDLRAAMLSAGLGHVPGEELSFKGAEAESVAQAALAFLGAASAAGSDAGVLAWESLSLGGDASGLRGVVTGDLGPLPTGWRAAAVTGSLVEGAGFVYLEPDAAQARALLAGGARESTIKVEVQNGSGALGAAEAAAEVLQALGYTLLPVSNADDFPDVVTTRIRAASDVLADGEQVRRALGVGEISEGEGFDPGTIVVVLGADFVPSATGDTGG